MLIRERSFYHHPVCLLPVFLLLVVSCRAPETVTYVHPADEQDVLENFFDTSSIFGQSLTGFVLYDPERDSTLYDRDGQRFFTPASNTKIFTLYASLKALPDTLPSLRYTIKNDTLFFRGTGDPAFLNPSFDDQVVFEFLRNSDYPLAYYDGHYEDEHFGSGWSWDWYPAAYAPEKAPFPIFGNMVRLQRQQVMLVKLNEEEPVKPKIFERYLERLGWNSNQLELVKREMRENRFYYAPKADTARQEHRMPFVYSSDLFVDLLSDTLGREITYVDGNPSLDFEHTLYGTPASKAYDLLMLDSDNLIGEQLLLMISDEKFGVMQSNRAIQHARNNYLSDLPDRPQWADGSGLTRYNLVTPRSLVALLDILYNEYGGDNILPMFPAGGETGTLRGHHHPPHGGPPFVYGKTGTLRNNTALSGYIFTDTGRRLIFSIINNNYTVSNNALRSEMEKLLNLVRESY